MPLPYDSVGTGQPLVLLHAGVADRTMWSEHLEPLAATGRRVIAPDLPGFGEADILPGEQAAWLDVISTMDELGIERAELIGSSFGAAVGLRVAAIAPSRVSIDCVAMGGIFLGDDPSDDRLGDHLGEDRLPLWEVLSRVVGGGPK